MSENVTSDEELIRLQEWERRIRREALEEAAQIISPPAGTSPNIAAVLEAAQRAIRALKEG